jgi:hypothetical protein
VQALWSIWKTQNGVVFDKKVVTSPMVLVYKTLKLSRAWHPLLKPKLDLEPMAEDMINRISSKAAMPI